MLNRVGARTQPCLTPLVTGNGWEHSPMSSTLTLMPSWNSWTIAMNLGGIRTWPWPSTAPHGRQCQTLWLGPRRWWTVRHSSPDTSLVVAELRRLCQQCYIPCENHTGSREAGRVTGDVEVIEQDAGQDFPGKGEQGDAAVVITGVSVPFMLLEVDYGSVFNSCDSLSWDHIELNRLVRVSISFGPLEA